MSPITLTKTSSTTIRRATVRPSISRPATERALRDIAFILHLTQQVKAEMGADSGRR